MDKNIRTLLAVTNSLAELGDGLRPALLRALAPSNGDGSFSAVVDRFVAEAPFADEHALAEVVDRPTLELLAGRLVDNGAVPLNDSAGAFLGSGFLIDIANDPIPAPPAGDAPIDDPVTAPALELDDYLVDGTPLGDSVERVPETDCARVVDLTLEPAQIEHRAQLGRVESLARSCCR